MVTYLYSGLSIRLWLCEDKDCILGIFEFPALSSGAQ